MEGVFVKLAEWMLAQGGFAVISGLLAWRLWQRENEITTINAARLVDTRETIKALTESTITLRQVASAQTTAADANRELAESHRLLQAEIARRSP